MHRESNHGQRQQELRKSADGMISIVALRLECMLLLGANEIAGRSFEGCRTGENPEQNTRYGNS